MQYSLTAQTAGQKSLVYFAVEAILKWFLIGQWSRLINFQNVYDLADDRRLAGCIVAKPYILRYQQTTMLFVYFIQRDRRPKIHKFCVEV